MPDRTSQPQILWAGLSTAGTQATQMYKKAQDSQCSTVVFVCVCGLGLVCVCVCVCVCGEPRGARRLCLFCLQECVCQLSACVCVAVFVTAVCVCVCVCV